MAAIGTTIFALLRRGDHLVSSSFLFGNTNSLLNSFTTQGIDVTFVDATDASQVAEAIRPETKMVFVETIANPRTQVSDLKGIGEVCKARGWLTVLPSTSAAMVTLLAVPLPNWATTIGLSSTTSTLSTKELMQAAGELPKSKRRGCAISGRHLDLRLPTTLRWGPKRWGYA